MMYSNFIFRSWSSQILLSALTSSIILFSAATGNAGYAALVDRSVSTQENVLVKGRITDQVGNAISGALIKIKNTSNVSKSDVAGVFELNDVPLKSVIIISHPKFSGEEFKISKPKPYYRIVLKRKTN